MRKGQASLAALLMAGIGLILVAGPAYGLQFNVSSLGPNLPAGTQVEFVIAANQCNAVPLATPNPVACGWTTGNGGLGGNGAAGSPGIISGTVSSSGTVNLVISSYSYGNPIPAGGSCTLTVGPFYIGMALLSTGWTGSGNTEWMPLGTIWSSGCPYSSGTASPFQFTYSFYQPSTQTTYYANVNIYCGSVGTACPASGPYSGSASTSTSTSSSTSYASSTSTSYSTTTSTTTSTSYSTATITLSTSYSSQVVGSSGSLIQGIYNSQLIGLLFLVGGGFVYAVGRRPRL